MTIQPCERIGDAGGPHWLHQRMKGIGGSEAAAACGVSEFDTPLHVYHRKRGELSETEENDAMRLGTLLEPVVRSEFTYKTGLHVDPSPGHYRSVPEPFMLATPDGEVCYGRNPNDDPPEGFEAKTSTWRMKANLGNEGGDSIPNGWLMQCQHYCSVMGYERMHVAVLIDGRSLKTYEVERNERLISHIITAEKELWERILIGDPPEPNWEHSRTSELLIDVYDAVNETRVDLSVEAAGWWDEYEMVGREIRAMEKGRKELKARVLQEMGDAGIGVLPGGERMVKRSTVERKGYTVEPSSYVRVSAVKAT